MSRVLQAIAAPITIDRDGISLAQTVGAPADLLLNGVGVSGGIATLNPLRPVAIFAVSDESAKTFTVYGTDRSDIAITEVITGPTAGATVTGNKLFKTVTRIAVSAALTGNVEAGWTVVSYSRWIFAANSWGHYSLMLRYILAGTATFDVQATSMEMNNKRSGYAGGDLPDDVISLRSALVAGQDDPLVVPHIAYRLKVTAQNANVTLRLHKSLTG
jgi:hypothetical protein